ncbi:MAG: hypothetical protein ACERKN_17395 [Velocimicrobium sp.]
MEKFISKVKNDFNVDVVDYMANRDFTSVVLQFSNKYTEIVLDNIASGQSLENMAMSAWKYAKNKNYVKPFTLEPIVQHLNSHPLRVRIIADLTVTYYVIKEMVEEMEEEEEEEEEEE